MRWIKANDRLPTDTEMVATPIVWRVISSGDVYSNNANPKLRDDHGNRMIYFKTKYGKVGYPLSALVWLDESPDPAEVLVKALEEITGYTAYNGDDWAKRTAEAALAKYKNMSNEIINGTENKA